MQKEDEAVNRSWDADSLRAACGREGCPICTVVLASMQRLMDTWQYEGFTDVEHRHELIQSKGFCPLHTWQLAQHHNAFQLALVYEGVLTEVLATLDQDAPHASRTKHPWLTRLRRWFRARPSSPVDSAHLYEHCPLCLARSTIEQRVIETLVELVHSEEMQALLRRSTGLCRLHFRHVCTCAEEQDVLLQRSLIACQRACLQRTLEEVKELIRKHDYRFGHEPRGDEMTAWRRAALLCVGNAGAW